MAYRFKLDEPFEKGFRRIAREQLDRALSELTPLEIGPVAIHESRKALKRLRALVRLAAPAIGDKAADRRNSALRKSAHLLSSRRDEAVLLDTIAKLDGVANAGDRAALAPLREAILARAPNLARPLDADTAEKTRLLLIKEAKRFAKTPFKTRGYEALWPGLDDSYRAGRRALKRAYAKPSDEAFHDLRKAVQQHWRHMALLSRAWPDVFHARVVAARELSQILGDDHDLAVLMHVAKRDTGLPEAMIDAAGRICRAEQKVLREAAEFRAERLFAEPPGAFRRRINAYWASGRHVRQMPSARSAEMQLEAAPAANASIFVQDSGPIQRLAAKTSAAAPSQRRG